MPIAKSATPTLADYQALLHAALAINDQLLIHADHVEYTGSMNLALDFRELVNKLWHKGWSSS